ncbi:MAG: family 20 glycosylhydrolase [Bacteroidia bacterium]|nr:family 20 glycosylhydrolase [Bacteroidia bacterium]
MQSQPVRVTPLILPRIVFLLCLSLWGLPVDAQPLPVIPLPVSADTLPGYFLLHADCVILAHPAMEQQARLLPAWTGMPLSVHIDTDEANTRAGNAIRFVLDTSVSHRDGYELRIEPQGLRIHARSDTGAFYALQTLRQLLPASLMGGYRFAAIPVQCAIIRDEPRFEWRGFMLDCSRHFFSVDFVKRMLDRMALLKLNRFHWHLTDDQGWRPEITRFPKLIEVGAWRDRGSDMYGGYYTKDDMRDIIAYAAERFIMVIPEIDMPGHSTAALVSYPVLGCTQLPVPVSNTWGIHGTVLCAGRESTFDFVDGVIQEIAELFPGPYIHLGGDEVLYEAWNNCDACKQRRVAEGLANEHELQSWFMHRAAAIVQRYGKKVIGWNEMMIAGGPPGAIIQIWQDMNLAEQALLASHKTIISHYRYTYFDYGHDVTPGLKTYFFDPAPAQLLNIDPDGVLGVEACLWSESSPSPETAYENTLPRLAYFAETAWTPFNLRDTVSIQRRVAAFGGMWTMNDDVFWRDPAIMWDDGRPLTVLSAEQMDEKRFLVTFSDSVRSFAEILHAEITPPPLIIPPVAMTAPNAVVVDLGAIPNGIPFSLGLSAFRKSTNPWVFAIDSGRVEGSPVLSVLRGPAVADTFFTFPNPVSKAAQAGSISMFLKLSFGGQILVTLHDMLGREIRVLARGEMFSGLRLLHLDIRDLSAGSWYIRVAGTNSSTVTRFIVLR